VLDGNFALGCDPGTDTYISMCERTNEVLEPITFVLAYPTVLLLFTRLYGFSVLCSGVTHCLLIEVKVSC